MTTSIAIHGYAVGDLWWPMGAEAWKPFTVDVSRERARIVGDERTTLRDVVELATSEQGGDFCGGMTIAQGELVATRCEFRGGRRITTERRWPLSRFPSLADYCHPDPDWWPAYGDDDMDEAA